MNRRSPSHPLRTVRKPLVCFRIRPLSVLALVIGCALLLSACPPSRESKISVVLPLTGDYSSYGEAIRKGVDLAIEDLELAKPELGLQVEVLDSQSNAERGRELTEEAFKSSVAVIGGATSAEAIEAIKAAEKAERALISPTASSPELSGSSRYFFRIFPSSDVESAILAGYISNQLSSENLAILFQNDSYGIASAGSIREVFTGQVVAEAAFDIGGDLTEAVATIVAANPQAVYVSAIGDDLVHAIQALRRAGIIDDEQKKQWILTSSALASPELLETLGEDANRVFLAQTAYDVDSEEEPVASFVADYKAKYGEQPGYYSAHGYDAMMVAAAAVEEADSGLPADVIKALRGLNNFPGVTGSIQFRESGDVQKFTKGYWIVDGIPVDYEKYVEERVESIRERQREIQRQMEANARRLREVGS